VCSAEGQTVYLAEPARLLCPQHQRRALHHGDSAFRSTQAERRFLTRKTRSSGLGSAKPLRPLSVMTRVEWREPIGDMYAHRAGRQLRQHAQGSAWRSPDYRKRTQTDCWHGTARQGPEVNIDIARSVRSDSRRRDGHSRNDAPSSNRASPNRFLKRPSDRAHLARVTLAIVTAIGLLH
jgi:hypothetical protein